MTGTQMVHVPYRGETLVLNDMIGGHVDVFFGKSRAALPQFRDGKVKILAIADNAPLAADPRDSDHGRSRPARPRLDRLVRAGGAAEDAGRARRQTIAKAAIEVIKQPEVQARDPRGERTSRSAIRQPRWRHSSRRKRSAGAR